MNKVGFAIVKLWIDFLSVHPYWLLHLKSDCLRFLAYHVVRYRRKVVRENLVRAFPDKDLEAIKAIERRFYRNLFDVVMETPKLLHPKNDCFDGRVTITNPEMIVRLQEQGKSLFYAIPHSGNWEWFGKTMLTLSNHHYLAVYKKVKSPVFERLMLYVRTKNNEGEMVEANSAMKRIAQLRDRQNAVLMVADQTPRGVETDYWNVFLHQETCWFTGLERMAKMLDYAVVFVAMKRVERSRYEVTFHLITDEPAKTEKGFIMESYARCTERSILDQPDNWLWSHRRWKHQRKHNEA